MKSGGCYDHHSEYQQRVAATGAELIRDAIARTPSLPDGASFVIADYGASTGKSSAASMRTSVDAVRASEPDRAITAIHNDAFDVETIRTDPVANPYLDAWQEDRDAAAYGKAYAAFVRGFTESSLRTHLFTPGTRGLPVDELLDDYFARLEARFVADPETDAFEDWTLTVVVARI